MTKSTDNGGIDVANMRVRIGTASADRLMAWRFLLLQDMADFVFKRGSPVIGFVLAVSAGLADLLGRRGSAYSLRMAAHRVHPSDLTTKAVLSKIDPTSEWLMRLTSQSEPEERALERTIILRLPKRGQGQIVKGIILISFTATFGYYHKNIDVKRLGEYFHIILEPSWASYCDPDILAWAVTSGRVIVQASEPRDRHFISQFGRNFEVVSFGASDWVNYATYFPTAVEKRFDALYIANYNPVKRLHVFFRACQALKRSDTSFRAAVVCARWGGSRREILNLIPYYGLEETVELFEGLDTRQVNTLLNLSKVNVLLSLKEGSNRSLFEGLFAGTPAVLLAENRSVNKDYINKQTGMVVQESELVKALVHFRKDWTSYSPRQWALANIRPELTTRKLLQTVDEKEGMEVLDRSAFPVFVKVNQPEVEYFGSARLNKIAGNKIIIRNFAKSRSATFDENKLLSELGSLQGEPQSSIM